MDVVQEIVFVNEFLGDVGQHDTDVLWSVERGLKVEVFDVKGDRLCALPGENTVEDEFIRSSNAVLVPTSPGYVISWPALVMQVRSRSAFSGLTLHTTFEKATLFLRSGGMSS